MIQHCCSEQPSVSGDSPKSEFPSTKLPLAFISTYIQTYFFSPIFLFFQIFCQQIWSCIYNKYRFYSIFYAILVSSTLFNISVTNLAVQQQHPSIKKPEVNHFQVVLLLRNQSVYLSLSDSRRKLLKAALKKTQP